MDSKQVDQPLPIPLPATSKENGFRPNWSGLPELALHSISRRLPSIPDFLSFSSVCTSWNSTSSASTDLSTSFPPLLLLPVLPPSPPPPPDQLHPNYTRDLVLRTERSRSRSYHPTHFLLRTLTLENQQEEEEGRSTFLSKIPSEILTLPCLGYTDGSLVFLSSHDDLLILADAFSGTLRRVLLPPGSPRPRTPLLTAAGTHLLLASDSVVLSYRLQTDTWSQLDHGAASLAALKDQVYCIGPHYDGIVVIESTSDAAGNSSVRSRPTEVPLPDLPEFSTPCRSLRHRLVTCGSDLLLLRVRLLIPDHLIPDLRHVLDVFRLDSGTSTWAEVEGLEDWCLFLDAMGSSATACPDPARWGGKSNCAYVTGPGCDSWVAVPLDGDRQFVIDDGDGREYDICNPDAVGEFDLGTPVDDELLFMAAERMKELLATNHDAVLHELGKVLRWPSPVWVYPTRVHRRKVNANLSLCSYFASLLVCLPADKSR